MAVRVEELERILIEPKVTGLGNAEIGLGSVDAVELVYGVFSRQASTPKGIRLFKWVRQHTLALRSERGVNPLVDVTDVNRFDEPFRTRLEDQLLALRKEGKI